MTKNITRRAASAAGVLALGAAFAVTPFRTSRTLPEVRATRGSLVESIVESGTLTASRLSQYGVPVGAGSLKILEIAAEGRAVAAGDVIIRFDASGLAQGLRREEAAARELEASAIRAREDYRIERLMADGELDTARRNVASAARSLASERDGKGLVALEEAQAAAAEAERELTRSRGTVDDLKPLLKDGFITRAELDRAEQALKRADDQQRLTARRVEAIARFDRPAAVERASTDDAAARDALARLREAVTARLASREAGLGAVQAQLAEAEARVITLREQIARATIRAERPGLVVHRELFFGPERRRPQVGDEAWPNQPLLVVPDSADLVVESRVRETDLHKVQVGTPVSIRVEAYPDLLLQGRLSMVGAVGQLDPLSPGVRFFPITIAVSTADSRLRTGMSARVEMEIASVRDAVLVPLATVFELDASPYCLVATGWRTEKRSVTVAARNDVYAALARGVLEGERLLLAGDTTRRSDVP
jgi:multidrug resistance efflux pump